MNNRNSLGKEIFSLPINPKIDRDFVESIFIPFLQKNKNYIFDLYFTCRMPPFNQDAMGDVFTNPQQTTFDSLYISNKTGIPLSATFNNIWVRPTQENLDIFIQNFKFLYDKGVRIATIPHTTWVMTGQIQKEFPELYIKNTILREVTRPNEIVSAAKAGFNYVNLDRDLMRDRERLLEIKEAKDYCASIGKPVKLSLLANETCWGGCPIMTEHYQYNSTREENEPPFFGNVISRVSCSKWDIEDASYSLKQSNIPPWKKDWEEFLDIGIDVFKMHGRESVMRLKESMDIIERWSKDEEILFPQFNEYIEDISLEEKPIDMWREKIKTCKFDCWKCNYCESVIESRLKRQHRSLHPYVEHVIKSIDNSAMKRSNFNQIGYSIEGLSSNRVRHLLNNLCSIPQSSYLEVGTYTGSTFVAAIMNNTIESYAVDNYSQENISPARKELSWTETLNPKDDLYQNLSKYSCTGYKVINSNALDLSTSEFKRKPNIIFYDGDHSFDGQYNSLKNIFKSVSDTFILVIDDANFDDVVPSAQKLIEDEGLTILFDRQILTPQFEDKTSWWNGLLIYILQK